MHETSHIGHGCTHIVSRSVSLGNSLDKPGKIKHSSRNRTLFQKTQRRRKPGTNIQKRIISVKNLRVNTFKRGNSFYDRIRAGRAGKASARQLFNNMKLLSIKTRPAASGLHRIRARREKHDFFSQNSSILTRLASSKLRHQTFKNPGLVFRNKRMKRSNASQSRNVRQNRNIVRLLKQRRINSIKQAGFKRKLSRRHNPAVSKSDIRHFPARTVFTRIQRNTAHESIF